MLTPIYQKKTISIEVDHDDTGFTVKTYGQAGTGIGIDLALQNLGTKLYARHTALSKVNPDDLSEKALDEMERLRKLLARATQTPG
jgi:hypothetical protein